MWEDALHLQFRFQALRRLLLILRVPDRQSQASLVGCPVREPLNDHGPRTFCEVFGAETNLTVASATASSVSFGLPVVRFHGACVWPGHRAGQASPLAPVGRQPRQSDAVRGSDSFEHWGALNAEADWKKP